MIQGDLSVLSAMITPTVLILATGSLLLTTSQRLSRSMDRARKLAASADAPISDPSPDPSQASLALQLGFAVRRSCLLQQAMVCLYLALGAFVATSIALGVLEFIHAKLDWMPVTFGIVGTFLLLVASVLLIAESSVALRAVHVEMEFLTRRLRGDQLKVPN